MVEGRRAHADPAVQGEALSRDEVLEDQLGPHHVDGDGEHRLVHLPGEHLADAARGPQMAGPDEEVMVLAIGRPEEREAIHVVPVGVGEEKDGLLDAVAEDRVAEAADAGARVEDDELVSRPHLDARGVPAISHVLRQGAGDAASHAPESNIQAHVMVPRCPRPRAYPN